MIEQGTEAWFEARRGKLTASRISDAIARTKSGWGASRANYMAQLVAERLTGEVADSFQSPAMKWGTETEPEARSAYEFFMDETVEQIGFVDHPNIPMAGASPDGLIGNAGLIEIKCPNTATHIDTLRDGKVPGKYLDQMQWQMACTDRKWCDFASYDPRLPANMRLFVQRVYRDLDRIVELEHDAREFLRELDETVAELTEKYGTLEAAE